MDGPPGASIVASENDSNLQADSDGQQDNSAQEASDIQGDIDEPTSVLSQSNLDHLERDTLESRARKQIEQALISLRKGSTIFNSRETSALIQAGQDWIERKDQPRAIPQSYQLPSRPPPPSSSPPRPHPPGPPPFRQKKKYGPDTLDCNIQRASMSTWSWAVKIKSHVLQVFYRGNAPIEFPGASTTDDDFKKAYDNSHGLEKPVRVKINSALLVKELENIAGQELDIRSESYLILIPPFKLLVHNWDRILGALQSCASELEDLGYSENTCDIPSLDSQLARPKDTRSQTSDSETDSQESTTDPNRLHVRPKELQIRMSHLQCLVDFMNSDLSYLMGLKLRIQEGSLLDIAFDDVYYLYSPGDIVISNHDTDGAMQLQQVYSVTGGRQRLTGSSKHPRGYRTKINEGGLGSWTDVVIDCYVTYWNGDQLGPIRKTHRVPYFTGKKIITEMRLYPIQFQGEGADNLKARLVERGQRVVECFGHKNYDSMTVESVWDHGSPPISSASSDISTDEDTGPPRSRQALTTDVYIDIQAWNRERPLKFNSLLRSPGDVNEVEEERYGPGRRNDYRSFDDSGIDIQQSDRFLASPRSITRAGKLTELEDPAKTFLMLLPTTVPGFDLRRRRWVWLNIDNIEDIDKSDQARARGWEDLVINKEHRELLSSLVQTHTTSTTMEFKRQQTKLRSKAFAQMDLVKEKGRGLIILLHGPPGTGKTSTAETIAAYTGKPLYAITCGDIGASPTAVEKNLAEHTERAARWDCVLLLDEADVFLARRGWTDVYRNALVSIFLRHIEYYTGILFLTTNIVGIIDEAFKSRIHIALRYDPIDLKATKVIWENMLNRIEKDNEDAEVKIKFNRDALMRFAREHYKQHEQDDTTWNARQIRNAFTTAIAMGQYDYIKRAEEANLEQYDSRKKGTHSSIKRHDKIRLTTKNFEKIADTATDFEQYIGTVRGRDADNALDNEYRNDNFGRNRAPPRKDYRRQTEDEWITSILSSRTGRDRYSQQPPSQPSKGKKILKRTDDRYRRREDDEAEEDVNDEDEDEDEGDDDEIEDSSSEEDASE